MARQHGVTTNTYKKLVLDSGAVYKNYGESGEALLGATRGGNTFTIEQDIREMPVDGAKGKVKGMRRIIAVNPVIVANFVEISKEVLALALPGSSTADYPDTPSKTHDQITRALEIALGDYATNIAIVGEVSGNDTYPCVCLIKNVIAGENLELGMAPNDEAVQAVTFQAHFDSADLDAEPWAIRWPEIT